MWVNDYNALQRDITNMKRLASFESYSDKSGSHNSGRFQTLLHTIPYISDCKIENTHFCI